MTGNASPDDWVTGVEAAEILGVHSATVSRWASDKLMPAARKLIPVRRIGGPGGPMLFDRRDVLELKRKLEEERK